MVLRWRASARAPLKQMYKIHVNKPNRLNCSGTLSDFLSEYGYN